MRQFVKEYCPKCHAPLEVSPLGGSIICSSGEFCNFIKTQETPSLTLSQVNEEIQKRKLYVANIHLEEAITELLNLGEPLDAILSLCFEKAVKQDTLRKEKRLD